MFTIFKFNIRIEQETSPASDESLLSVWRVLSTWIRGIIPALALLFPLAQPVIAGENPSGLYDSFQATGDIRRFQDETLYFDIGFLWFDRAARAKVSFYLKDGAFHSRLLAQTEGFVGFFTAYRQHIYETEFEIIEDGQRLRAKTFVRRVVEGDREERTEHRFDYQKRIHSWTDTLNGQAGERKTESIPQGAHFDDVLTAFYNFRNGAYGPIEKGAGYTVRTVPEKGQDQISIQVHTEQEAKKERPLANGVGNMAYLIDLLVPKELFNTETGRIRLWGSKHLIPMESTIEGYVFLGDLHATFRNRTLETLDQVVSSSSTRPVPAAAP